MRAVAFCDKYSGLIWDSGLTLSRNLDGLSLTGAEIFAFEICLENRTNFEEKNSVLTRFIYLKMLTLVRSWALCVWVPPDFLRGHFGGSFSESFLGVIWGVRCCFVKVLSRNLIVFSQNSGRKPSESFFYLFAQIYKKKSFPKDHNAYAVNQFDLKPSCLIILGCRTI